MQTKPFDPNDALMVSSTVMKPPPENAGAAPDQQSARKSSGNSYDNARAKMAAAKISSALLLAAIARDDHDNETLEGREARINAAVMEMGVQVVKSVDAVCRAAPSLNKPYFRNELRALVCEHVTFQWQRDGKISPKEYEQALVASLSNTDEGIGALAGDYVKACSKPFRNADAVADAALPHLSMTLSTAYLNVAKMVGEHDFGLDREKLAHRLMEKIKVCAERTFAAMYGDCEVMPDTVRFAMQNTINRACDFLQSEYRFAAKAAIREQEFGEILDMHGVSKVLGGVISRMEHDMDLMADAARRLAHDFADAPKPAADHVAGDNDAAKGG